MRLRDETIGGFTAGVAGTVLGFPLDLVKTRMQTSLSSPGMHSSNLFTVMRGIISRGETFQNSILLSFIYIPQLPPYLNHSQFFRGVLRIVQRDDAASYIFMHPKYCQFYILRYISHVLQCSKRLGRAKRLCWSYSCSDRGIYINCR